MVPMPYREMSDLQLLELAMYREARGEPTEGKRGVGHVIFNRSLTTSWWNYHRAGILANVILFPYQFSSFDAGDPNANVWPQDDDTAFQECCSIANSILHGVDPDITNGATYYFDRSINWPTAWGAQSDYEETLDVGRLRFFRLKPVNGNTAEEVQEASADEN